ncbi:bifunctional riboflavin kinase/FAD synthetase [Carboxylicivirga sp. N1Y132]|uniref:Riboflavin biosynthesis protein n=1 Tax=Carboxylicivirga marina TaxID=2800988 RepID=A0ABS1HG88_9BACT|nr:bifunctional riboflavin kinase/FAD synthetase [Carboxylicivirga marina]
MGMFDGVHTGHRVLLGQLSDQAKAVGGESVVITFWPHPRMVLKQDADKLRFLTSPEERTKLFAEIGIDHLVLIPFSLELAELTAEEFIKQILIDKLSIFHLMVGYNHRFGKGRQHNFEEYQGFAKKYNFSISMVEAVLTDGMQTSSTDIRNHLLSGEMEAANKILGYQFTISGRVVGGQQLGRRIGYPTANVEVEEPYKLIPPDGVYAVKVRVEGKDYGGMLNIGYRPTVNHNVDHRSLEVHIFDFNHDIYSEEIELRFIQRVRDEQKFANVDALKAQLKRDEETIRGIVAQS